MGRRDYRVLVADADIRPEGLVMLEEVAALVRVPAYATEADLVPAHLLWKNGHLYYLEMDSEWKYHIIRR